MLRFADTGYDHWLNVHADDDLNECIAQLSRDDNGIWGVQAMDFRITRTDHLRQIADKLDELNGVKNDKQS